MFASTFRRAGNRIERAESKGKKIANGILEAGEDGIDPYWLGVSIGREIRDDEIDELVHGLKSQKVAKDACQ